MLGLQAAPRVGVVRDPKERGSEEPIIEEVPTMKRILIALLAAVALCGVAPSPWADGPGRGHGWGGERVPPASGDMGAGRGRDPAGLREGPAVA